MAAIDLTFRSIVNSDNISDYNDDVAQKMRRGTVIWSVLYEKTGRWTKNNHDSKVDYLAEYTLDSSPNYIPEL